MDYWAVLVGPFMQLAVLRSSVLAALTGGDRPLRTVLGLLQPAARQQGASLTCAIGGELPSRPAREPTAAAGQTGPIRRPRWGRERDGRRRRCGRRPPRTRPPEAGTRWRPGRRRPPGLGRRRGDPRSGGAARGRRNGRYRRVRRLTVGPYSRQRNFQPCRGPRTTFSQRRRRSLRPSRGKLTVPCRLDAHDDGLLGGPAVRQGRRRAALRMPEMRPCEFFFLFAGQPQRSRDAVFRFASASRASFEHRSRVLVGSREYIADAADGLHRPSSWPT